ncbi:RluA family pseudouridine synthase [Puniceicoccaceae bacterium K14]|nr:RluA family pseudouridine synthase [Puniceicoccaceae bacterium K14]
MDKAVKQHFGLSWNNARAWVETGKVFLDGNRETDLALIVREGMRIELRMGAPKVKPASDLDPKNVVYFDNEIVVVNKPADVMTVPHPQSEETATLDRMTLDHLRIVDKKSKLNRASLGVVHRIDKDTSGLVVFTRAYSALQKLSTQFREHAIERKYYAIVNGKITNQTVNNRLVRDAKGDGIRGAVPKGTVNKQGELLGRRAVTHFEVVEELKGATLVACRLETGRTHQIRIHLSELGNPIVGEQVYVRSYKEPLIEAGRVMLHAAELGFIHPGSGKQVKWEQALPKDFKKTLNSLKK